MIGNGRARWELSQPCLGKSHSQTLTSRCEADRGDSEGALRLVPPGLGSPRVPGRLALLSTPCLPAQTPNPEQLTGPKAVILLLGRQHLCVPQPAATHNLDTKAQYRVGEKELRDGAEAGPALLLVLQQFHHIEDLHGQQGHS